MCHFWSSEYKNTRLGRTDLEDLRERCEETEGERDRGDNKERRVAVVRTWIYCLNTVTSLPRGPKD